MDKDFLIKDKDFEIYKNYNWKEIKIGCSDTQVFQLNGKDSVNFLKIGKSGSLRKEYLNLINLYEYLPIPKVIFYKDDGKYEYLITEQMLGEMSCSDENLKNGEKTINAIIFALQHIQSIKIDDKLKSLFKYDEIDEELKKIKIKIDTQKLTSLPPKPVFAKFSNLQDMYNYLANNKPAGEYYFSHGDVSMPNVFLQDGNFKGFIDIGNAGIRLKWYDITDAYVSIRRNFKSEYYANLFLSKMNIKDKKDVEYFEMLLNLD